MVARFVDRGILSYDEKITTYWPEFGQGNKENVTLGDLVSNVAFYFYVTDIIVVNALIIVCPHDRCYMQEVSVI